MDETILFPSPNWFQYSGMSVSSDGWIVYGGPSKSLCVLEPLPVDYDAIVAEGPGYKAHVFNRVHPEKIVSVDFAPDWPTNPMVLAGSSDGSVRQWSLIHEDGKLKANTSLEHQVHKSDTEEVAGVGYSNEQYAITVGCLGNLVKWDVKYNVVKNVGHLLKGFKPTCMSCSKHALLNVAVGTKQGVVFVLDLNGTSSIVYKVRAHDEDILSLSWCPQYEVQIRKALDVIKEKDPNTSLAARLEKIRNEPEPELTDDTATISATPKDENTTEAPTISSPNKSSHEDSLNETVVEEDDMFDIYKDHESEEFGHKKYQPEAVYVKVKAEKTEEPDYLAECLKLKDQILKAKENAEASIESLVDNLEKAQISEGSKETLPKEGASDKSSEPEKVNGNESTETNSASSVHIHRHLLVTIGKYGSVRIWSKAGKSISSCAVVSTSKQRVKTPGWLAVLWYKPDVLLVADGKSQLLQINPLTMDSKNKLVWSVVHSLHRRGLYAIVSCAPRVQTDTSEDWPVWSVAQDRSLIQYSMKEKKAVAVHATCGGFVYTIAPCPYDATKIALSVGDGAVRVWETDTRDDGRLSRGRVTSHWQNVQGKVVTVAWHPTRENLLAFGTAESRVGLISTSANGDKPAKVLPSALPSGVYGLCWDDRGGLYACGGGELVVYHTANTDEAPTQIRVELDGKQWRLSVPAWCADTLLVGSTDGAVAALDCHPPHTVRAAAFPFTKMVHHIERHPQQVSASGGDSPLKDYVAVCSLEKVGHIAILQLSEKDDESMKLTILKMLSGHKQPVLRVSWDPHRDGILLSTSQDGTVRVWDVQAGTCTAVFSGHRGAASLGAACLPAPAPVLRGAVLSGGGDCALRLWREQDHPSHHYTENETETTHKKKKNKKRKPKKEAPTDTNRADIPSDSTETTAAPADTTEPSVPDEEPKINHITAATEIKIPIKGNKTYLFPITHKQMTDNGVQACRKLLRKYAEKNGIVVDMSDDSEERACDFIKMFGNINEVNELLELELTNHAQNNHNESWIMVSIFRGHMDAVFEYANQRDIICSYLLSLAPCVSFKYWKDVTQLYLTQVARLIAREEEDKLNEFRHYGGILFRKVATLLSTHDVRAAVDALLQLHMYKEAYILCRVRHMDSIAEETLRVWARQSFISNLKVTAAICHIALGDLPEAASLLGKSDKEEVLGLAAEVAKLSGQSTYEAHIVKKTEQLKLNKETQGALTPLPSLVELLVEKQNGDGDAKDQNRDGDARDQKRDGDAKDQKRDGDFKDQKRDGDVEDLNGDGDVKEPNGDGDVKE